MKVIIVLCGFIALTCGEVASSNKYGTHYTQHEQSVIAAKQSLQDRLAQLEAQNGNSRTGSNSQGHARYGNSYSASGSEKYVGQCAWCGGSENRETYSSRLASESQRRISSSNHGLVQGYAGSGVVGFSEDDQDVQSHVDPWSSGTSSRFSSNAHEADDMQQRVVAGDSSSAYRSHMSEDNEDELQRTVGPTATRTNSYGREASSSDSHRTSYGLNSQRTSVSLDDLNEPRSRPVPTGQYISMGVRPGTATVLRVPVRVIDVQGVPDDSQRVYSTASERSSNSESSISRVQQQQLPSSATYRVTYTPTYTSSGRTSTSRDSESQRTASGDTQRVIVGDPPRPPQPEKFTNYNNFNSNNPESASQTRSRSESRNSEDSQVRVAPIDVSGPTYGGSSRFATTGSSGSQYGYTQSRAPVYSASNVESSSSSSRTAEEREQRRFNSPAPTYVSQNRFAASESETNRNTQAGGASTTYYVPSSTRTQSQYQAGSGSQTQYQSTQQQQRPGHYSPYAPSRSQSGAAHSATSGSDSSNFLSSRSGSGVLPSGTSTDDLRYYMSESERLARLQQQQLAGSSSSSSAASNAEANRRTIINASNLDSAAASFVGRTNLGSRTSELDTDDEAATGTGTGNGYNRVRSWNKQSSWSSGSQYGPDGKPKTYSTLSTAEAEKHNINGAETGYKAATTTLENDGKVSTYSIHTP